MKKVNKDTARNNFNSNENLEVKKLHKIHTEELGIDVPEGYFSISKNDILDKTVNQKPIGVVSIFRKKIVWMVAASILLLVSISVFTPNNNLSLKRIPEIVSDSVIKLKNDKLNFENITSIENDILITSLFVDDDEVEELVDNYIIEELIYDEVLSN